ncbi:hypothetical protein BDW66DRAFT_13445 [Aspergillus desertorum]
MSSSPCTRLHNQCDECRIVRSKLPRWINPSFLECPGSTYPVIFTGTYVGTRTQAEQIVKIIQSCVCSLYDHDVPIYAASRRAKDQDKGLEAGPWVDITTQNSQLDPWGMGALPPGVKLPGGKSKSAGRTASSLLFKAPRLIGLADLKPVYHSQYQKVHTKRMVVTCLVDFPLKIRKGGDIEQAIMHRLERRGFRGYTRHPESEQDQTPHASLHRLDWWAYTHPEVVREELGPSRESRYKPGEVYVKNNAHVRKKR